MRRPYPDDSPANDDQPRSSLGDAYRRKRKGRGVRTGLFLAAAFVAPIVAGVVLLLTRGQSANPLNAFARVNPPMDSVKLDETIIVEGRLADFNEINHYDQLAGKLSYEDLLVVPSSTKEYKVLCCFSRSTDMRKYHFKGGPPTVRFRGKVNMTYPESRSYVPHIALSGCVDISGS